jgi:hypothetical protein
MVALRVRASSVRFVTVTLGEFLGETVAEFVFWVDRWAVFFCRGTRSPKDM